MLPRHHVFRIGCVLLVITGLGGLTAIQRALAPINASSTAQAQSATTRPVHSEWSKAVFPVAETNRSQLDLIHQRLDQQRQLGPAAREHEDEIRCALHSQLTDENAARIVRELRPDDLNSEFGLVALSRWAATDSLAATLWLAQQPAQSVEQTWAIAQALVKDPVALAVLSERFPAEPWRDTLLAQASRASMPDNPVGALSLAQCLPPGPARTQALLAIADEWTLRDPGAAAGWIAGEQDSSLRDELIFAATAAQVSTDPVNALTATFSISSTSTFDRAVGKVTAMWADFEPGQAKHFTTLIESYPVSPAP